MLEYEDITYKKCNGVARIAFNRPGSGSRYGKLKQFDDLGPGYICLLYTSPSPRDKRQSRMPSSA